jgi:hypothetical protein
MWVKQLRPGYLDASFLRRAESSVGGAVHSLGRGEAVKAGRPISNDKKEVEADG